ncbi:MAG: T9SS type A sorting domain-containing protein [Fibrobacteres bacterium]|nr:T9SS type A sorting domain-containing protein [Fibrobacterota bacterium]
MRKNAIIPVTLMLLVLSFESFSARPTTEQIAARRANSLLAKIADTLTPGTWAKVPIIPFTTHTYVYNDTTYNLGLLTSPPPSRGLDILGWTDDSHWDSVTGQYLHMGMRQTRKFISYTEESNSWKIIPLPFNHDSANSPHIESKWGHIYANNAFDIENSRFYHHAHAGVDMSGASTPTRICYYDLFEEKWTLIANPPSLNKESVIEYFNAKKGLITLSQGLGGGIVNFYSDSTKRWVKLDDSLPVCGYHSTGRHNPFREEILITGGNYSTNVMMRIKKDGTIERLNDSPVKMGVNSSIISVDPVSGRYLIKGADSAGVDCYYEFDSDRNSYRKLNLPKIWSTYDMPTCAFVAEYKVVMWQYGNKVYVYKHDTAKNTSEELAGMKKEQTTAFTVSPNPVSSSLSFNNGRTLRNSIVEIYDASGKRIEKVDLSIASAISTGNRYSNGVYFAKLSIDGKANKTIRFLVAR